ncbi:hypothetical protein [Actinomadura kijaniata]|uniref:hypothetical protein n=1 Tax=Actinomadura kijaniata TaxID=46161 RepID=UPI000AE5E9A8|nr:hypothetical protein [Actinomadura kijaniata]
MAWLHARPGEHTGVVLLSDQQGVPPPDQVTRDLEIFAEKVMPEFARDSGTVSIPCPIQ